jgi:hypothetical protein
MSSLTIFLSRLIGLLALFVSLSMAAHRQATVETVTALVHDPPLLLIIGMIALTAGLAIVLGHNVWTGGALPIVVTLFGWLTLVRGLLLLFLAPDMAAGLFATFHLEQYFYVWIGISFILGVYLTYGGFSSGAD